MKKTGIAILVVTLLLMIAYVLRAYLTPQWYVSNVIIEAGGASFQDLSQAFQEVAPKSPDVNLQKISNTDLVDVSVRDANAQQAADKANSIAAAIVQKLQDRKPQPLRVLQPAEPATLSVRPIVWASALAAVVVGLFPATIGLILVILGGRSIPKPV